jgi:hypothetical protein
MAPFESPQLPPRTALLPRVRCRDKEAQREISNPTS